MKGTGGWAAAQGITLAKRQGLRYSHAVVAGAAPELGPRCMEARLTAPTALIFDMDGVLVDTIDLHYRAWKRVADAARMPFTQADMDRMRGKHRRDCLRQILRERPVTEADVARYFSIKDDALHNELEHLTPADVLPGVLDLLRAARSAGLRLAVASSSTKTLPVLRQTDLLPWFDAVAHADTVRRPKPNPDVFVWAAGALRAPVEEAVVFEDAAVGVEAAQTCGMFAVGLGTPDLVGEANLVLPGLDGLTLEALRAAFEARTAPVR